MDKCTVCPERSYCSRKDAGIKSNKVAYRKAFKTSVPRCFTAFFRLKQNS